LGHARWIYDKHRLEVPVQLLLCNDILVVAILKDGRSRLAVMPLPTATLEVLAVNDHWEDDLLHVASPDGGDLTLSFPSTVELSRWKQLFADRSRFCLSSELQGPSILKRTPRTKLEMAVLLQQGNPYEPGGRSLIGSSFNSVSKVGCVMLHWRIAPDDALM
jgi:hypothetical protein